MVRDSRGAFGLRISMHIAHTSTAAMVNLSEPQNNSSAAGSE